MKIWNKLCIVVIATIMIFGGVSYFRSVTTTNARTSDDTTSYVSVGELFDTDTKSFNVDNFDILLKYISGDSYATIEDIDALATTTLDANDIYYKTLSAGIEGNVEYVAKAKYKNVSVKLGGLNWQVMYLSKDNNDNAILSLWLDSSIQDVWEDRASDEGEHYGFYEGGLFSDYAYNWCGGSSYISNMYGRSYINAVTLNNGGVYSTQNDASYITVEKNENSVFALFTMDEFGLTDYIVTPRNVSWQETQSYKTLTNNSRYSYNYPNDAWSNNVTDTGFYPAYTNASWSNYNYAGYKYNDAWADSYLWLPSYTELSSYMWSATWSQFYNGTGEAGAVNPTIGKSAGTGYYSTLLRSGTRDSWEYVQAYDKDGNLTQYGTHSTCAVRPALHLNLSKIENYFLESSYTTISSSNVNIMPGNIAMFNWGDEAPKSISLKVDETTLIENEDYKLVYSLDGEIVDKISGAGEYIITAKGINNYRGQISFDYTVTQRDISVLSAVISNCVYDGTVQIPSIVISDGTHTLAENEDYQVYIENNINAGFVEVVITGIGNFSGEIRKFFEILPLEMSDLRISIEEVSDVYYTGEEIKLQPKVFYNDEELVVDEDYYYEWSNNVNSGVSTIKVKGIGNFIGEQLTEFKILKLNTSALVKCGDEIKYEGNQINLQLVTSSVPGIVVTNPTTYILGEHTYNWTFIPDDILNYYICTGTIEIKSIAPMVMDLIFYGDYKKDYVAYEPLDITNLVVALLYNSGKTEVLDNDEYGFSIEEGKLLTVTDSIIVKCFDNTEISRKLPITITQRPVEINEVSDLVETGEKQYLSISFNSQGVTYNINHSINYFNISKNTNNNHILERGKYTAKITLADNNYILVNNEIEFEVCAKSISSTDEKLNIESVDGFKESEVFTYCVVNDKDIVLLNLSKESFDIEGNFIAEYSFNLSKTKNITIKFKPKVNLEKLQVYKLVNDEFKILSYTILDDGKISISCNSEDKIYLFESVNLTNNQLDAEIVRKVFIILIVSLAVVVILLIGFMAKNIKNKKIIANNNSNLNVVEQQNTNDELMQKIDEIIEEQREIKNTVDEIRVINEEQSSVEMFDLGNSSLSKETLNDVDVNNNSNILKQNEENVIIDIERNEETLTGNDVLLDEISNINDNNKLTADEIIKKYVVFDATGNAVALREGAPKMLREAFNILVSEREKENS